MFPINNNFMYFLKLLLISNCLKFLLKLNYKFCEHFLIFEKCVVLIVNLFLRF